MTALEAIALRKSFGSVRALDELSFRVAEGEFFTVVGPTNAGKSTLLKTIAGLYRPDAGAVLIRDRDVAGLQPKDRRVSLLFQNIALFPTLTGFENLAFPLRAQRLPPEQIEPRVRAVARMLRIEHLLGRHPRTFSGGEQQRTAIGRAIIQPSDILLLDEPLTNLDARIRIALRIEFKKLHRHTRQAILYVTHDQVEAMSLSDRVGVLNKGRFEQIGTPDEVYHRPRTRFVASFIGTPPMNLLPASVAREDGLSLVAGGHRLPLDGAEFGRRTLPPRLAVGVRPEEIRVAPQQTPETPIPADVIWVERLGSRSILDIRVGGEVIKAVVPPDGPVRQTGTAWLGFTPRVHQVLDLETERFLQ